MPGQPDSRVWSCASLKDGVDFLIEQSNQIESKELELEKMIQEHVFAYI